MLQKRAYLYRLVSKTVLAAMLVPLLINLCSLLVTLNHLCCKADESVSMEHMDHASHQDHDAHDVAELIPETKENRNERSVPSCCEFESMDLAHTKSISPVEIEISISTRTTELVSDSQLNLDLKKLSSSPKSGEEIPIYLRLQRLLT